MFETISSENVCVDKKKFFFCLLWSELLNIAYIGYLAFEAINLQPFEAIKIWQGLSQLWNHLQVVYSNSRYLIIFSADTISATVFNSILSKCCVDLSPS